MYYIPLYTNHITLPFLSPRNIPSTLLIFHFKDPMVRLHHQRGYPKKDNGHPDEDSVAMSRTYFEK